MHIYFENKDWKVTEIGIELKNTSVQCDPVDWVEIKSFYNLEIKTIRPFYIEPFPFFKSDLEKEWFNKETYTEAFTFAVGKLALMEWNRKAAKRFNELYPNAI